MSDFENEEVEELDEESFEQDEAQSQEDENSDEGEEGTPKKKESNWKKVVRERNELRKRVAELEKQSIEERKAELPEGVEKADWLEFALENPEAKELKNEVLEFIRKYPGTPLSEALEIAKARKPKVSKSKTDFDLRSGGKKKDLSSVTEEEALALPPKEFLAWERSRGTKI